MSRSTPPEKLDPAPALSYVVPSVTITELLKKQGLATGHFGKWYLGFDDSDSTCGIDMIRTIGKSRDKSAGRDDDLYSAAIDFIRDNKDGPLYVNVWGHATHFPVNTAKNLPVSSKMSR